MSPVTVFRDKFARSWPQLDDDKPLRPTDRGQVVDLGQALERDYTGDAHFAPYRSPDGHRLNYRALAEGTAIELNAIVFDVDGPGHSATPAWHRELREKVVALAAVHPDPYYYETRGGARIVYRQAEPTILETEADALEWSRIYTVAVAHLEQRFGIVADPSCCDWQRLYRLPRATRDRGESTENHPYWGDANKIGSLTIQASWADVAKATKTNERVFKEPRELPAFAGGGDGLLFWLLKHRGDVIGTATRGGWICRCPNRRQHTSCTDGGDATVVYPANNGEVGFICCKHSHCIGLTLRQWLAYFSDSELEAAREAAGIVRTRVA